MTARCVDHLFVGYIPVFDFGRYTISSAAANVVIAVDRRGIINRSTDIRFM